jgi:EAL domain-containing protein (putative c-di-GMP-specific phosphodiesterase class I)
MSKPAHKIALLHDDPDVVKRIGRVAAASGLEIFRPHNFAALLNHVDDPLLSAMVLDLAGPRDGGFDQLKRLYSPSSRANIVVVAGMDEKSAAVTRRLAESRGLDLAIFPKGGIDDRALAEQLCRGRDQGPRFGPAELDDCIENKNFRVEYQPKVPLFTANGASVFGVEALCRMHHPRFGTISPDRFIPMAEKTGLIFKLTDAVACDAFRAFRDWQEKNLNIRLAINVSPELLRDTAWSELFLRRCAEFGIKPASITLEITESAAGATDPAASEILSNLRSRGFTLSIDDFGTGFSSLATLYRLPVSELKIDKSFILDLQESTGARTLVESTVSMAQRIGLKVVAEGVETEAVFKELGRMGCHEAQGFFIGRSMPAEQIVPFFTGWKTNTAVPARSGSAGPTLPKVAIVQSLLNEITANADAAQDIKDLRQIPPLVLKGNRVAALSLCHAAIAQLTKTPARSELQAKIAQLQSMLEAEIVSKADVEIETTHGLVRLIPRTSVTLGRPSVAGPVDLPINCRWLSTGDRTLKLFLEQGEWFLEDRGSTHGHFIAGERIAHRRAIELPYGKTAIDIGMASGSIAPLSLVIDRSTREAATLTISFYYEEESLSSEIGRHQWPQLETDISTTWIVFGEEISVGRAPHCTLLLEDCRLPTAATIRYQDGFWISPLPEAELRIGEAAFRADVPLPAQGELDLSGAALKLRAFNNGAASAKPAAAAPRIGRAG